LILSIKTERACVLADGESSAAEGFGVIILALCQNQYVEEMETETPG